MSQIARVLFLFPKNIFMKVKAQEKAKTEEVKSFSIKDGDHSASDSFAYAFC